MATPPPCPFHSFPCQFARYTPPMPYEWTPAAHLTEAKDGPLTALRLWPYRSLPPKGFAAMILLAFGLGTVPLSGLLGTRLLWVLLPFILLMVGALWLGLARSYRDGEILEELFLDGDDLLLRHTPVKGTPVEWRCNVYWAKAEMHVSGGKVPFYVTLSGNGRRAEIGSFLSEDERKVLHGELQDYIKRMRVTPTVNPQ